MRSGERRSHLEADGAQPQRHYQHREDDPGDDASTDESSRAGEAGRARERGEHDAKHRAVRDVDDESGERVRWEGQTLEAENRAGDDGRCAHSKNQRTHGDSPGDAGDYAALP